MSILNKNWKWIPAATHGDVAAFAERQRKRMADAEQARQQQAKIVRPMLRAMLRKAKA